MASESVELPLTTVLTKSPVVKIKRHSVGKASSGNSSEKTVPRYMRASTGSCHDLCKYGGKHAIEAKERRSIPNRATRKKLHQSYEDSIGGMIAKSRISLDSKPENMSSVILKESVDSKARISDALDTNTCELSSKSFESKKPIRNEVKVNRKKTSSVEVKPSLLSKSYTSASTRQEISSSTDKEVKSQSKSTSRKVETLSKPIVKKVKTISKSTPVKKETLQKSTLTKVENTSKPTFKVKTLSKSTAGTVEAASKSTPKKAENLSKPTSKVTKNSSKPTSKTTGTSSQLPYLNGKEMKLSVKHLTYLNTNRVAKKKVSSSMNSSEGFDDKRVIDIEMEKKATSSKTASRKPITPIKASSSPRPTPKRLSSLNSRKHKSLNNISNLRKEKTVKKTDLDEHNNNEAAEKILHVINMESEKKTLQSDQNASYDDESYLPQLSTPKSSPTSNTGCLSQEGQEEYESEFTTSEFEVDSFSGNCETECFENKETLKVEKKSNPRNIKEVEDKDTEMIKLKFRRGKVVDNQIERNTPRRLKFRSAKTLSEKANVKEKVVLRHQDIKDKKDAQRLLNNVIEETASKLVEARKSKVKALVGAFETVISLHEKKPSARSNVS